MIIVKPKSKSRPKGLGYLKVPKIFEFFPKFLVSCYPDAGSDRHGQLPGNGRHVDVIILHQGPDEANQEHNHVEDAEPDKPSCKRHKLLELDSVSINDNVL